MEIEELTKKESELYSIVLKIYNQKESDEKLYDIFNSYRQIHKHYANLSEIDNEALKRGLFIQWYSKTEPNYLTGIGELDEKSEFHILKILEDKIQTESLDIELKWMLNYYAIWDYTFEKLESFPNLNQFIKNRTEKYFPKVIDKLEMCKRGQMGEYWNSLIIFDK
ncbi:hypothetical protein FSS13T_27370 [Flavobacterium saliperosum S13]|uniref:Uncharacterized protein n=2 Tax=Flavobacterium saliperosum TaxID=329186 RepID=A0A1G4WAC8_9FLAO|nr:hypothetical protein [Flavobacterium saliperosum]ESU21056.1 hypothetical protein FSS13T_27370 [Flavobacterium saliperosum S13]SCX19370.1 hypothetical protein SAMN02927925_02796 [Flavobacterium saliperosum]